MAIVDPSVSLSQGPTLARAHPLALVSYASAIFLSALLIFEIEPMFTKMVLPRLGGSPSVWSVAMVVFQVELFLGYLYAHLLTRLPRPALAAMAHLAFLAVVATTLPLGIAHGFGAPPRDGVTIWLVGLFFASIGLPFIALAASAPLLQSWFTATGHRQAVNPYVLYSASSVGSFAGLIAYPFLVEPLLTLKRQAMVWTWGYYLLAVLIAASGFLATGRSLDARESGADLAARPTLAQGWTWAVLAAIPSALVIAVTAHISTDLAAAPLLWVVPLGLYLLTFVAVFRDRPWVDHATMRRLLPYGVAPLAITASTGYLGVWFLVIVVNLFIFVLISLTCHGEAYRRRPHRAWLTEFYLWISFGGALGGIFAGLIAPNIFNNIYEYSILIAIAVLVLPTMSDGGWREFTRKGGPSLTAATILAIVGVINDLSPLVGLKRSQPSFYILLIVVAAAVLFQARRVVPYFGLIVLALLSTRLWHPGEHVLYTARSFFGVHRVLETEDGAYHVLLHGTTMHGIMRVRDAAGNPDTGRPEPLAYYYFGGPISDAIQATRGALGGFDKVAVVGLGAGGLACHARDGEQWTFFEIDPVVLRIASDPKLFRFLSECAPSARIVLGDARLTLAAAPEKFDLIVLDAFSSDAIPVHLLTREAFAGYLSRLTPHGVIAAHVTNRNMELVSVLAAMAAAEGLAAYSKSDNSVFDGKHAYADADVVAIARTRADLGDLPSRAGWRPAASRGVTAWTDDYSNVLGAIARQKFGW